MEKGIVSRQLPADYAPRKGGDSSCVETHKKRLDTKQTLGQDNSV